MVYFNMPYEVKILSPAAEFLDSLSDRLRAKAVRSIVLLRELGPLLREPHAKKVTDWKGLFELRVALGGDTCRLFYFWYGSRMVVVTSGYMKKGMKLERRELERATSLMNGYLASGGEDL
jgi:phage-related protein